MKPQLVFAGAVCLAGLMASGSYAGVTINGTTITFSDATVQSTAKPSDHGGTNNTASGTGSFIGGGQNNTAIGPFSTVGGGGGTYGNMASGWYSTVAGGGANCMAGGFATTVGGGYNNFAIGHRSTVSGGFGGSAMGYAATVGGGYSNQANGEYSTVAGGRDNRADGDWSTIAGGWNNRADGDYSFVAGKSADDGNHDNVFVWGDGTGSAATAANTFNVNASGGIFLNGGGLHTPSDRNMKEAFSFVSARDVLDKVVEMPVTSWRFKSEDDSIRHIGPVAQDFMATFGYGVDDTHITSTDADGVALAAIQALHELHLEKDAKLAEQAEVNTALRWHNAQLKAMLRSRDASLEARFVRLEKAILRESEPAQTGTE